MRAKVTAISHGPERCRFGALALAGRRESFGDTSRSVVSPNRALDDRTGLMGGWARDRVQIGLWPCRPDVLPACGPGAALPRRAHRRELAVVRAGQNPYQVAAHVLQVR